MADYTRIISDIHYGDRSSRVRSLTQLVPLLNGPAALVLNGDTLDTRVGPYPELTEAMRSKVVNFFPQHVPAATFLSGNHDADFTEHVAEFADGKVCVTHGDILYPDIVPWSQDAPLMRTRLAEEFARIPPALHRNLETRFAVFRRVAFSIPQRHQSQRHPLKYAVGFARDTIWPPSRLFSILRAWQQIPELADAFVRDYQPRAKFLLVGHTHQPGIWRRRDGLVVINTGSFSLPLGGTVVDIAAERLLVRRVEMKRREFHPGRIVAEFSLAAG